MGATLLIRAAAGKVPALKVQFPLGHNGAIDRRVRYRNVREQVEWEEPGGAAALVLTVIPSPFPSEA